MAKVLIGNVKGPQGDAATISVGTVSTGAAGSNAAVTNSGTSSEAVLNFTIPQGAKGDAGDPGVTDYATSASAGLVRIGTDFNIDSSTGTISENNTFSQASTLAEINSGDSHATILGKIKKFMNTLMPSTFVKDNLTSTDTDKALSAKQGKLLAAEDALLEGDLATVQSSSTASRAFNKGEYLVLEGQLYKVTSNIANGGTITPGTNVSSCSAGGELTSLNDSLNGSLAWTMLEAKTGKNNPVTIPTTWHEANIRFALGGTRFYMFHVVKPNFNFASSSVYSIRTGYYVDAGNHSYVSIDLVTHTDGAAAVSIGNAYLSGSDLGSTSTIQVVYR